MGNARASNTRNNAKGDTMTTADKKDVYQTVTDNIVAMLERGVKPWAPQWSKSADGLLSLPLRSSGETYRGLNLMLLWGSAEANGFRAATWMTFNQAKALGGCVRKGSKGTQVVYWGRFDPKGADGEETDDKGVLFAKSYTVFNVEQIDGLPDRYFETVAPMPEVERIARAEAWVAGTGAEVRHGGNRAYFSPAHDFVQMPPAGAFVDVQAYYGTLAHELTHWSGHEARLSRTFGKKFGDQAYAFEELVAELGAAFASARLGIASEPREDHASYLASWLKVLRQDKRAIFTAASKAQAACDYLFDLADKALEKAVERPSVPVDVICLPDLSGLSSAAPVEDDDDTDPTPPMAPCPSPVSPDIAAGFLSRLTAFKGGRVRAPSRVAARRVRTVEDIVADITTPAPERPFHPRRDPSLCEFLSVRGICDDGGELSSRDLDRWHREAPFRRKLVRADGVSLERAAMMAFEAGYFPDVPQPLWDGPDNMHPVSEAMLLEALESELRADYAAMWGDHDEAFFA